MEDITIPKPGDIYKHFKNNLYQIITVAIHSETGEQMVVYQALYGSFKTYVRPLTMFISEVDHIKYPEVSQKYRFESIELEDDSFEEKASKIMISNIKEPEVNENKDIENKDIENNDNESKDNDKDNESKDNESKDNESKDNDKIIQEESSKDSNLNNSSININTVLMTFLDAKTYEDKLNIVIGKKKYLNDRIINDMAASIDCSIEEGSLDKRIQDLIYNLSTLSRFEFNRFR
ncbi:MAG: hypothetical protein K0R92_1079 [Lachnospiraceae bacterium]|jgi:hypothetical protein|nr:hypothetical protein [Lachnospiraceae bacterium]